MSLKLMNVEAILAIDLLNGLAKNEKIPWKSKTDMIFFKNKTLENTVIMGSKTLLSLPNSKPLKNRNNIVITNEKEKYSNLYQDYTNCFFLNLEETLCVIQKHKFNKFFIIGGNQIYNILLPYCSGIWLTKIKQKYDCDLIFNVDISMYDKEIIYEDTELEIMYLK
jgi:dihydrofolate reductase